MKKLFLKVSALFFMATPLLSFSSHTPSTPVAQSSSKEDIALGIMIGGMVVFALFAYCLKDAGTMKQWR